MNNIAIRRKVFSRIEEGMTLGTQLEILIFMFVKLLQYLYMKDILSEREINEITL